MTDITNNNNNLKKLLRAKHNKTYYQKIREDRLKTEICSICSGCYSYYSKSRHFKTKRHQHCQVIINSYK